MYYTYILESQKTGKYYFGQTENLEKRLEQHNSGYSKSTKSGVPWRIVFYKEFETRIEAVAFEAKLKSYKNKKYIEEIITGRASR